ncbi:MAG: Na+/H+ antiporter NhaA, partial [Gluconobacter cerinus]
MSKFSVAPTVHIRRFLAAPAGGASVLMLASLLGLVLANSSWASGYGTLIT